jgi:DNA-binding IclR family transcriptional regulator
MRIETKRQVTTKRAGNVTSPAIEDDVEEREDAAVSDEVGVAAVNRAFMILECFSDSESMLSLAAISKKTGLYKSTILRLLQSLEVYGYIVRLASGAYVVGAAPVRLASIASKAMHPAEKIMPILRDLVHTTGVSASFYVHSGNMRLCAYRVDSSRSIRDNVKVGQMLPLNRGAGGRVLVEFGKLESENDIRARLPLMRVTHGERDSETAAMASPVFGPDRHLEGALSLSGPIQHFDAAAVDAMAPALLRAAQLLTTRFLGDPTLFDM